MCEPRPVWQSTSVYSNVGSADHAAAVDMRAIPAWARASEMAALGRSTWAPRAAMRKDTTPTMSATAKSAAVDGSATEVTWNAMG